MTFTERGFFPPGAFLALLLLALWGLSMGCASRAPSPQERQMAEIIKQANKQDQEKRHQGKPRPHHLELARELLAKKFYKVALVQLEQARETAENRCEISYLKGKCCLGLARYPQAVESFRQALSADAKYAPAYNGLGLALDHSGSRDLAWKAYAKALELNPARADFQNNFGFSLLVAGHYPEAEKHLRESLALNPELQVAINNLALCYALQGSYGQAARLLKGHSSPAAAANNLGVLHDMNGDRKKALQYYRAALSLDANLRAAKENLGNRRDAPPSLKPSGP